jgi:hypothetical protein
MFQDNTAAPAPLAGSLFCGPKIGITDTIEEDLTLIDVDAFPGGSDHA